MTRRKVFNFFSNLKINTTGNRHPCRPAVFMVNFHITCMYFLFINNAFVSDFH